MSFENGWADFESLQNGTPTIDHEHSSRIATTSSSTTTATNSDSRTHANTSTPSPSSSSTVHGRRIEKKHKSCKECIRLKLRCSRSWPCTNCVRRKCSQLCPEGALPHRETIKQDKKIKELMAQNERLSAALDLQSLQHYPSTNASESTSTSTSTSTSSNYGAPAASSTSTLASTSNSISARQILSSPTLSISRTGAVSADYTRGFAASLPRNPVSTYEATLSSTGMPIDSPPVAASNGGAPANSEPSQMQSNQTDGMHEPEDSRPANPLESAVGQGPGVLQVEGDAIFHGRGAGALFFIDGDTHKQRPRGGTLFPFGPDSAGSASLTIEKLPSVEVARSYVETYFNDVNWMYRPASRRSIEDDLDLLYSTSASDPLHPHRLAILVLVFAIASIFQQPSTSQVDAAREGIDNQYLQFAAALLTAPPWNFMSRPTVAAIKALHIMISLLFCSGDREGAKAGWTVLGLAMRAAQSLGLHKNCATWKLSYDEQEERSLVWWELFTYDLLQSLNFGRPYSIPLHFVQCQKPDETSHKSAPNSALEDSSSSVFHAIKYDLALLFAKVADLLAAGGDLPDYRLVLELDRELKAHAAKAPADLRLKDFKLESLSSDPEALIAQRHMLSLLLHKALLALHRTTTRSPWFAKAVMCEGHEPMTSPYAASFNACVVSARKHVHLMRSLLAASPKAAHRWWFFLFHTFTAAIIQASVLLRSPNCMLNQDIHNDFDEAYSIFVQVAPHSGLGKRALPILAKLMNSLEMQKNHFNGGQSTTSAVGFDPTILGSEDMQVTSAAQNPSATSADPLQAARLTDLDLASFDSLPYDPTSLLLFGSGSEALPMLSSAGTTEADRAWPALWDPSDSIDQTLLFWNVATVDLGEFALGPGPLGL